MTQSIAQKQIASSQTLCGTLRNITFSENIIYNPLLYARHAFEEYVSRYGNSTKRVVFLGMNPGPWGMAQTGVPFGEIHTVRDWLSITAPIGAPEIIHPKRPVLGYLCTRSEVSGERLWGLFKERYKQAEAFFADHFVINYCPLLRGKITAGPAISHRTSSKPRKKKPSTLRATRTCGMLSAPSPLNFLWASVTLRRRERPML